MVQAHEPSGQKYGFPLYYPLREKKDFFWLLFMMLFLPLFINFNCYVFCERTIFQGLGPGLIYSRALLNTSFLLGLLVLLWLPLLFAILQFPDWFEKGAVRMRNLTLIAVFLFLFPRYLLAELFMGRQWTSVPDWAYYLVGALLAGLYIYSSERKIQRSSYNELRSGRAPRQSYQSSPMLFNDSITFFLLLGLTVILQAWMLANTQNESLKLNPYAAFQRFPDTSAVEGENKQTGPQEARIVEGYNRFTIKPAMRIFPDGKKTDGIEISSALAPGYSEPRFTPNSRDLEKNRLRKYSWIFGSCFCGLVFFLMAILPNRLMSSIFLPVSFHEKDWIGLLRKTYRYTWQFAVALAYKSPLVYVGGTIVSILYLVVPVILIFFNQSSLLGLILQPDLTILGAVIFFSWFTPVTLAALRPETTFGENFNRRLADLLMTLRGHLVLFGFGSLGKRVLDRELLKVVDLKKQSKLKLLKLPYREPTHFMNIVTPDLRLEKLCISAVLVEHLPRDIVFSTSDNLLGEYGVVGALYQDYRNTDAQGQLVRNESRVLVPVIIGEAQEHFISSRVNLERARNVISTIPDGETVRAIFERCRRYQIPAIINVSRSDQIATLTYRARHRKIVLVYPQQIQGVTLGYRLWAAILKMRAIRGSNLNRQWPNILVIGNSKANHYMLETVWSFLNADSELDAGKILEKSLAFLLADGNNAGGTPILEPNSDPVFNRKWPAMSITSKRMIDAAVTEDDSPGWKARVVNELDQVVFERALQSHNPAIIVVNHSEFEMASVLMARAINALERLKTKHKEMFQLPLLLLSTSGGEKAERRLLGDVSRKYDALCRMHGEPAGCDITYPSHTHKHMYGRELIGETVIDCLDDAEEIISGARKSFETILKEKRKHSGETNQPKEKEMPHYVEISSCLPNRPGALPDYLAALARMKFALPIFEDIRVMWAKKAAEVVSGEVDPPFIPSIQFLRHIILDPTANHFALSGFAALVPLGKDSKVLNERGGTALAQRVFANDGHHYVERKVDKKELYGQRNKDEVESQIEAIPTPEIPVVANVLNRLADSVQSPMEAPEVDLNVFRDSLIGESSEPTPGCCPGMINCRISAYQEYAAAYNNMRYPPEIEPVDENSLRLWHAKNYYCSAQAEDVSDQVLPTPDSPHARIFLCCSSTDKPGMIARALNCLFYKTQFAIEKEQQPGEWIVNIDYFLDTTCRNSRFGLNRLFGVYHHQPTPDLLPSLDEFPINYIRILPFGGYASFKQWYLYARVLQLYLNERILEKQQQEKKENQFTFSWLDAQRDGHHLTEANPDDHPKFLPDERSTWPVAIFLERGKQHQEHQPEKGKCHICQSVTRDHDCSRFRAWV